MPDAALPALSLVASPGKRTAILELAAEAERRGFAGIACPSLGGALACASRSPTSPRRIPFWTSIQPIYLAHPAEAAGTASHLHEVIGGRFRLGLGVSHAPVHTRLGVQPGKPLSDMRELRGRRPRQRPVGPDAADLPGHDARPDAGLAVEVGRGGDLGQRRPQRACRRSSPASRLQRRTAFFLANMVPTVIDDDRAAADAVNRRTMTGYVTLPNYRNYWKRGRLRGGDGRHRGCRRRRRARPRCPS